jgi:hypothetical protein
MNRLKKVKWVIRALVVLWCLLPLPFAAVALMASAIPSRQATKKQAPPPRAEWVGVEDVSRRAAIAALNAPRDDDESKGATGSPIAGLIGYGVWCLFGVGCGFGAQKAAAAFLPEAAGEEPEPPTVIEYLDGFTAPPPHRHP